MDFDIMKTTYNVTLTAEITLPVEGSSMADAIEIIGKIIRFRTMDMANMFFDNLTIKEVKE